MGKYEQTGAKGNASYRSGASLSDGVMGTSSVTVDEPRGKKDEVTRTIDRIVEGTKPNRVLFTVYGLEVRADCAYQIVGLRDDTAPAALQKFGTSKLPNPSVHENKTLVFDKASMTYDTGFFLGSACYRGIDTEVAKRMVAERIKNVREPYEEVVGAGKLDHTNYEFWDNYATDAYEGKVYFTNDINQLFELYVMMQSKALVPKDREGSPEYPNAMYCVEDKSLVRNIQQKRNLEKVGAIQEFGRLLRDDRVRLMYILKWLRFEYTDGIDDAQLTSDFYTYMEESESTDRVEDRAEAFLATVRRSERKMDLEQLRMYAKLSQLLAKGQLRHTETGYYVEGFDLGVDLRRASQRLVEENDMSEAKFRVLALTEDD
jgi:hypothetical protein